MATLETQFERVEQTADSRFFNPEHVLSVDQFSPKYLSELFLAADELKETATDNLARRELAGRHIGRQLCSLFYEPSTRTRLSFETAAVKFGMGVVSTENAREFSSAAKGETIEDTMRVLNEYGFDAIVLRHHETGAAAQAAAVSDVPVINAGDGKGEHPTQALLDAYTIQSDHGRLEDLTMVMGGDLKNGRTVRSLTKLAAMFLGNHIRFVSIPQLQIGEDVLDVLRENGTSFEQTSDMLEAFEGADVVYWTRLQKERLEAAEVEDIRKQGNFTIDMDAARRLPKHATIMHPLPRVDEISPEVDRDGRAAYFPQAGNGLYVRMALLDKILN